MKKLLILLLTSAIITAFTACDAPPEVPDEIPVSDTETASDSGTEAPETSAAPEAEKEPTVLYKYNISIEAVDKKHISYNSTRKWYKTAVLNDDPEQKFNILHIYNNKSSSGGLPDGEFMTVEFPGAPDIDTAKTDAVHLSFKYFLVIDDNDLAVSAVDELGVFVSTDGGGSWSENSAGLVSHTLLGSVKADDGKYGMLYEVVCGDITALVNEGDVITDIRLKPYGDFGAPRSAFRLTAVALTEYAAALKTLDESKEYITVPEETLRKIAVEQCNANSVIEWMNGSSKFTTKNGDSTVYYYPNYLHKGPPYTRINAVSNEKFHSYIEDGKLISDTAGDKVPGMDCTGYAYDITSRFVACGSVTHPTNNLKLVGFNNVSMLGQLSNSKNLGTTKEILKAFSDDEIYKNYASAKPGDVLITYPNHIRVVVEEPVIEYLSNGSVNPLKSYILVSESGGITYYYYEKPNGETVRSKDDPAIYQKKNPSHTLLYGSSVRHNEKYTFGQLMTSYYIAMTYDEYAAGKIDAHVISGSVPRESFEEVQRLGFLAAIQSNYRIIKTEVVLSSKDGSELYRNAEYPLYYYYDLVYSDTALNNALKKLDAGEYKITVDVTAGPVTEPGAAVAVTRVIDYEFEVK